MGRAMTWTRPRPPARPHAGRWLLLATTLVGVFAMHGLTGHGTTLPSVHSAAQPTALSTLHAAVAVERLEAGHVPDPGGTHAEPAAVGDHHGSGLLGLCLAVLVALAALAMDRLFTTRRTTLAALLPAGRQQRVWSRARGPAPPDLVALGVQRC